MQKLCKDVLRKLCFERLLRYFKCFKDYLKLVIPLEKRLLVMFSVKQWRKLLKHLIGISINTSETKTAIRIDNIVLLLLFFLFPLVFTDQTFQYILPFPDEMAVQHRFVSSNSLSGS